MIVTTHTGYKSAHVDNTRDYIQLMSSNSMQTVHTSRALNGGGLLCDWQSQLHTGYCIVKGLKSKPPLKKQCNIDLNAYMYMKHVYVCT